jgi:hypothetical protein
LSWDLTPSAPSHKILCKIFGAPCATADLSYAPSSGKELSFPKIISGLSFRDVEELLAERGIDASYETVRRWFLKFGPSIAANIRRSRPRPSDHWHLDEMVISIRGGKYWLWRAVDNEGDPATLQARLVPLETEG